MPAQTGIDAQLDRNTKGKLANHLASNVLSNDDEIAAQRSTWNSNTEKLHSVTGNWNAQTNMNKPVNKGGIDAYKQK